MLLDRYLVLATPGSDISSVYPIISIFFFFLLTTKKIASCKIIYFCSMFPPLTVNCSVHVNAFNIYSYSFISFLKVKLIH